MTDHERQMYQILGKISESDAPIVFKGALITKLILAENGYTTFERPTVDIDANWVGEPPSMGDLAEFVNRSLNGFNSELRAEAIREYGDKKSAGIAIAEVSTGNKIISMDISIKPVYGSKVYHYGEIAVRGVLANEILADKISVLSKKMIFRRAKDMIDVYALAHCIRVNTYEIFDVWNKNPNREIGAFDEFNNRSQEVEHSYERLRGIEKKPPFDEVYAYLKKFILPFAEKDTTPKIWLNDQVSWENINREQKPSILETLRKYEKETAKRENENNHSLSKKKDDGIDL